VRHNVERRFVVFRLQIAVFDEPEGARVYVTPDAYIQADSAVLPRGVAGPLERKERQLTVPAKVLLDLVFEGKRNEASERLKRDCIQPAWNAAEEIGEELKRRLWGGVF
jgi:hypothetical protein